MFIDKSFAGLVGFATVPALLLFASKSTRIREKQEHTDMVRAKFCSQFWERGTEFTRGLNDEIHSSILNDPDRTATSP